NYSPSPMNVRALGCLAVEELQDAADALVRGVDEEREYERGDERERGVADQLLPLRPVHLVHLLHDLLEVAGRLVFSHAVCSCVSGRWVARAAGLEPAACGFGDRCSAN